jgi:hypothetical protein
MVTSRVAEHEHVARRAPSQAERDVSRALCVEGEVRQEWEASPSLAREGPNEGRQAEVDRLK